MDSHTRAAHYLALLAQPRIGPTTVHDLVALAGGLEQLVSRDWSALASAELRSRSSLRGAEGGAPTAALLRLWRSLPAGVERALPAATAAVAAARGAGLRVLDIEDPEYPPALRHGLRDSPPVIFVAGELPSALLTHFQDLAACAVVGTRRAGPFSLRFAHDLGHELARVGLVVVSGLALGIDAAAHRGALAGPDERSAPAAAHAYGSTVAVLGGGHGRLHPKTNEALARKITDRGGAVISEWPPDVAPEPHRFLHRNRIISGLARAVVVVEAGARSGAINTAAHALKQGRDVYAVPGRPGPNMAGNHALLRDGASLITSLADLYSSFHAVPQVGKRLGRYLVSETLNTDSRAPRGEPAPHASGASSLPQRVHSAVRSLGEASVDKLLAVLNAPADTGQAAASDPAGEAGVGIAALSAALLELELGGSLVSGPDGRYQSTARLTAAPGQGALSGHEDD